MLRILACFLVLLLNNTSYYFNDYQLLSNYLEVRFNPPFIYPKDDWNDYYIMVNSGYNSSSNQSSPRFWTNTDMPHVDQSQTSRTEREG